MKIQAKNLRGFKDTGLLDLKPLTILVGTNSTGKSSFLRILPLLRQSFEKRIAGPILWNDRLVDFGSFKETLRKGSSDNIELTFEDPSTSIYLSIARWQKRSFLQTYKATFASDKIEMNFDQNGQGTSLQINNEPFLQILKRNSHSFVFAIIGLQIELRFIPLKSFEKPVLEMIKRLNDSLSLLGEQTSYIRHSRASPKRNFLFQNLIVDELEPDGGNMPHFLYSLNEQEKESLSNWLYEYFRISVEVELNGRHLGVFVTNSEKERFNLADIGFGFSQLLPVAIQSWLFSLSPRRVIKQLIIEQPELHLHPRYQSLLGDMFVGVIKAKKDLNFTTIIETHSYALIDRIGELVEEGKISKDKISILLFTKEDGLCEIRKSNYNEEGILKNWPAGFFSSYV